MSVKRLTELARDAGLRVVTAESCTGGMIAAALTEAAGSSGLFDRGFVTYSNAAKIAMLNVRADTLAQYGAVSEEVATEMATGALAASGEGLAIAVTGIAGPGGSEFKPEGRVCFAVALAGQPVTGETVEFGAIGRAEVRLATVAHAVALMIRALQP